MGASHREDEACGCDECSVLAMRLLLSESGWGQLQDSVL